MTIALLETPAPEPKSEPEDRGKNSAVKTMARGAMGADSRASLLSFPSLCPRERTYGTHWETCDAIAFR